MKAYLLYRSYTRLNKESIEVAPECFIRVVETSCGDLEEALDQAANFELEGEEFVNSLPASGVEEDIEEDSDIEGTE